MPLPSTVRERCRPFLDPDEVLHYLFPAYTQGANFIFAVTDRTITILHCGAFNRDRPKGVYARLPRATRIGPVNTNLDPVFRCNGMGYRVDDQYVSTILAADAEIAGAPVLPPDPEWET
ncbi:hypothetical protein [Microbispora sp. ATCC PTA-5024]|uniref:hypothetical protein n=1 Tax=Microbispora sp. ATCC PTA-5024 TaxID=316330 RepID=UPI0003DC4E14|nr:hypothetical protein [Microbispora sp. ATCC PTA-5024]ETK30654.1 hypothetical protein MPTA5024_39150 [Microbispora sp. ATCC PTA-5024]